MKTNFGFIKVASAVPQVKVADCEWNISQIEQLMSEADENGASVIVFPELQAILVPIYFNRNYYLTKHLKPSVM